MVSRFTKFAAVFTAAGLALSACSDSGTKDSATNAQSSANTVTVQDNYGTVEIKTPVERVVATDNRTFQILDQWGVTPVAVPKPIAPSTVPNFLNNDQIVDLGTHREPNLEAMVATDPDLIISGQRFSQHYKEMKKLNPGVPIVDFEPRDGEAFDAELKRQVTEMGVIFNKEGEAKKLVKDFEDAVARAKKAYNGSDKVMAVNVSGGAIGYIAPHVGRVYGPVFDLLGLKPALQIEGASSNHKGDDISVEAIADSNPDWILVLDRDGAIMADDAKYTPAKDVIAKNQALAGVTAVKNQKVLVAPQDTYRNESIITYTKIFNSIADAFEQGK
ncbi:siderophore ABC transporter substrate-binding protein [Corynebacterium ulcerans]|uniref:siderophore ABC transporter substrate-binding protein n=1 Tax=Corynebacterium ulcerans TaxID=65058 RepID=UPI0005FEADAC|nr:ABC transporter substrate-binding protein [Corynebacterium ulcerans]AKA96183.1 Periplasmic binding protein [Corynebacterium ulcerans]